MTADISSAALYGVDVKTVGGRLALRSIWTTKYAVLSAARATGVEAADNGSVAVAGKLVYVRRATRSILTELIASVLIALSSSPFAGRRPSIDLPFFVHSLAGRWR